LQGAILVLSCLYFVKRQKLSKVIDVDIILKPFYFIRHGETDWNNKNIYMGSRDIPINKSGMKQAAQAASMLRKENIQTIVTGPLSRAVSTAEIVAKIFNLKHIVMNEFKQCCWGSMEGKPLDNGTMIQKWIKGETPPGAETAQEFDERILSGLQMALELPGPVLIVSHGGVYRSLRRSLGLPITNVNHCTPYYHTPPETADQTWRAIEFDNPSNLTVLKKSYAINQKNHEDTAFRPEGLIRQYI